MLVCQANNKCGKWPILRKVFVVLAFSKHFCLPFSQLILFNDSIKVQAGSYFKWIKWFENILATRNKSKASKPDWNEAICKRVFEYIVQRRDTFTFVIQLVPIYGQSLVK